MDLDLYLKEVHFEKQLKNLKRKLQNKKVIFYGAGLLFQKICENYDLSGINVIGVTDRKYNETNINEKFYGYKKIILSDINSIKPDYVVVSALEYEKIIADLKTFISNKNTKIIPFVKKSTTTKIKTFVEKITHKEIVSSNQITQLINNRKTIPNSYVSFGEKNPDKKFFVIFRSGIGAGFISNLRWMLRHLALLESTDFIPVIDTVNFPSVYSEKTAVNNTNSWWEYYFEPVSEYSLEEVYQSKNVFLCNDRNPEFISPCDKNPITMENLEKSLYSKYFRFNKLFQEELNNDKRYQEAMKFLQKPTLGFHFRGTDMTYEKKHPTPLNINQAIKYIEKCLKKENLSQVFLATDSEEYKEAIIKYCNGKGIPILCINETFGGVPEIVNDWSNQKPIRYLHGKDMLLDLICLSKCKAMLGIRTNILVCAQYLTENKDMTTYYINNGLNTQYRSLNKIRWKILKHLPANHRILNMFGMLDRLEISK